MTWLCRPMSYIWIKLTKWNKIKKENNYKTYNVIDLSPDKEGSIIETIYVWSLPKLKCHIHILSHNTNKKQIIIDLLNIYLLNQLYNFIVEWLCVKHIKLLAQSLVC